MIDRLTCERRTAQVFVAVLGASNFTYAQATWTQGLADWISAHVATLAAIAGVRRYSGWTVARIRRDGAAIGPATSALCDHILDERSDPEQGFRLRRHPQACSLLWARTAGRRGFAGDRHRCAHLWLGRVVIRARH